MEDTSVTALDSRDDCVSAVAKLVDAADLHIAMFTQRLEPLLYNHREICESISRLARKNRHSRIRIIAQDTRSAAEGHCLMTLAQQLSSSIQIRIPASRELQRFEKSLLIIDDHSMAVIDDPERYEGKLIENNRLHIKTELAFFDDAWENSLPDPNSRRLHI